MNILKQCILCVVISPSQMCRIKKSSIDNFVVMVLVNCNYAVIDYLFASNC